MLYIVKKYSILVVLFLLTMFVSPLLAQDLQDAITLTRSEQFAVADKMFNTLMKEHPSEGDIYFYYGDNYLRQYFQDTLNASFTEMTNAAQALFTNGIQAEPSNPVNYAGLAEVAMLKGNSQEAQSYIDKAYAMFPTRKNKLKMDKEIWAHSLIKMADAFVKAGVKDTAQIFKFLTEAQEKNTKDVELYIVRGDAYILLVNDGSNAIANYNIATSLNPNSSMAKLRIGQLWMRAKQYQMALDYYEDGVKIDSTFAPAYRELGFLLFKAGRYSEAKKMFRKFLELSGGNIQARLQFINTLMELRDYSEAITEINKVLTMDTTIIDVYRARAYALFENKEYEAGLVAMEKFFDRSPEDKIRTSDITYYGRLLSKNKKDSLAAIVLYDAYEMDTSKVASVKPMCWMFITGRKPITTSRTTKNQRRCLSGSPKSKRLMCRGLSGGPVHFSTWIRRVMKGWPNRFMNRSLRSPKKTLLNTTNNGWNPTTTSPTTITISMCWIRKTWTLPGNR